MEIEDSRIKKRLTRIDTRSYAGAEAAKKISPFQWWLITAINGDDLTEMRNDEKTALYSEQPTQQKRILNFSQNFIRITRKEKEETRGY